MGNPAHTATQGVNLRIQGPRHPPIGPITPPIPRAMPPSMHAREDEADAGNEHPPRTSRGHTHKVAQASSLFRRRGRRWQRGRPALAADTRTKWPRPRDTFAGEADAGNGADNGTTPGDLAALTPRCAAGPDRWSMGNPAHTATQGVNLRSRGVHVCSEGVRAPRRADEAARERPGPQRAYSSSSSVMSTPATPSRSARVVTRSERDRS